MTKVVNRFLRYVKYDTKSDDDSITVPSTDTQLVFARDLKKELEDIGLQEVTLDENGYVFATIPSNIEGKEIDTIGFIAHYDTSPDISGKNVNPRIVENYDGNDIVLNKEENIVLHTNEFPEIKKFKGKDLIVTDGTTLLGADDKAGVSEIVTAAEYLINHPEIKHGKIRIGFTPDEEIGRGADHFDVEKFGAKFAYTVDGGEIGELEYENFNAAGFKLIVKGRNVHPGTAKNKMINSIFLANEFIGLLPKEERPETTEGYQGFYHLNDLNGDVEKTVLRYIIRDFDLESFNSRKEMVKSIVENLNKKHGEGTFTLEMKDQYSNMKSIIEKNMYIVDIALKAMEELSIEPKINPIRGGTDGARLSFMGLPTPNLFTGGMNFHGRYEYIPTHAMEKAVELIIRIAENVAKR